MFLKGQVDKVILTRPAVEAGEKLGFLPGDIKDKIDPYMQPLYDALYDFLPTKQVTKMLEDKIIEIIPLGIYERQNTFKFFYYFGRRTEYNLKSNENVFNEDW